jgi:seryl-tRNA synthetase
VIDLRSLRQDPDTVRALMARRNKPDLLDQLDHVVRLDVRLRDITAERDGIRHRVNEISKRVGEAKRAGVDTSALQDESRALGDASVALGEEYVQVEESLRSLLLAIPNVPSADAAQGAGEHDNPVVSGPVNLPDRFEPHQRVPHWEAATALGILDNERAVKISGAMFTMQRGAGATMARALCQLALDRNADAFEEIRPPSLVTSATLTATGQLPKFADDAFAVERDDLWCIPTAEASLTSLHAGEVIDAADLPRRYMAHSSCYRREAGSAGRDTRGMLRAHEFDKVEILSVVAPEDGPAELDELLRRVVRVIAMLELPYRVIEVCTGDLGQSHHRSFDVEVYAPGCDSWLEVSSVSWFGDYQARRADIRLKRSGAKGTELAHTLNASALAVPRVWAAIVENNRRADGTIEVPLALHPYMRGITVIGGP